MHVSWEKKKDGLLVVLLNSYCMFKGLRCTLVPSRERDLVADHIDLTKFVKGSPKLFLVVKIGRRHGNRLRGGYRNVWRIPKFRPLAAQKLAHCDLGVSGGVFNAGLEVFCEATITREPRPSFRQRNMTRSIIDRERMGRPFDSFLAHFFSFIVLVIFFVPTLVDSVSIGNPSWRSVGYLN